MFSQSTRAAAFVLAFLALPSFAVKDISVSITGSGSTIDADNFKIKTIITNTGDETVTLLNEPNSVLTPQWKTNIFGVVANNGAAARFKGMKVKWSPELAIKSGDVTVIEAGKTIEIEHDLDGIYDFANSGAGVYTITAKGDFKYVSEGGEIRSLPAHTSSHVTTVSGNLVSVMPVKNAVEKRAVGFNGCSSTRQSQIQTAVTSANTYVSQVNSYLSTLNSAKPRFTTWFGPYSSSSKATIVSHFSKISGDPSNTTYDCTCTDSSYAYVYPSQPGYVYLCNAFWSAPNTGTDSRAGTIIHEQSHFTVNGGTDDYAYGQTAAKNLAKSSPSKALFNADSHEYFAENTPALS